MTYFVSSTASLYVLVVADEEATARTLGLAELERLHANRFDKYGLVVPVELVCVREAEEHEVAMADVQARYDAEERLAMTR